MDFQTFYWPEQKNMHDSSLLKRGRNHAQRSIFFIIDLASYHFDIVFFFNRQNNNKNDNNNNNFN